MAESGQDRVRDAVRRELTPDLSPLVETPLEQLSWLWDANVQAGRAVAGWVGRLAEWAMDKPSPDEWLRGEIAESLQGRALEAAWPHMSQEEREQAQSRGLPTPDLADTISVETVRAVQRAADEQGVQLRSVEPDGEGGVSISVDGSLSPRQVRALSDAVDVGPVSVGVGARTPSQGEAVESTPVQGGADGSQGLDIRSTPVDGTGDGTGGGGTTGGGAVGDEAGSGMRQVPGTLEVWQVDGQAWLVDQVPNTDVPLAWRVDNAETASELGVDTAAPDRTLTQDQFRKLGPVDAGFASEIQLMQDDPWQQFMHRVNEAAELRPWVTEPDWLAMTAVALFEGREPTLDELRQTDWYNEHSAAERDWMERSATAGTKEIQRQKNDARRTTEQTLRESGIDNAPDPVVDFIATQSLTGRWSESYATEQVSKLSDPQAPGELDSGLLAALRDPDMVSSGDANAVAGGFDAVRERIRRVYENRGVTPGVEGETPSQALDRFADEVMDGVRTVDAFRKSADYWAQRTPGGRPGGLDTTREQESEVRSLVNRWLGPAHGDWSEAEIDDWAGRLRNNPDGRDELVEKLKELRLAAFPGWENENTTYEAISGIAKGMFRQHWNETPDETDPLFLKVANMRDHQAAAQTLRREGWERGVGAVTGEAVSGALRATGGQVRRAV